MEEEEKPTEEEEEEEEGEGRGGRRRGAGMEGSRKGLRGRRCRNKRMQEGGD